VTAVSSVVLTGVTKRFGATMALRGVDAAFPAGEVAVVMGPNGSGKSTLLGAVAKTLQPTAGTVEYRPLTDDMDVRSEIGLLSHDTLAYADLSGRANIEIAGELQGMDANDAWERAKVTFELGSFAERPVRTNSRGQRQRIALARALVHEPSVVLLDEPTTGLDSAGVERLLRVVANCQARGAVVIVVTHDSDVFSGVCATVWKMERGKLHRFT
jgi:ABC-type multidrug transport system ATPase subunit